MIIKKEDVEARFVADMQVANYLRSFADHRNLSTWEKEQLGWAADRMEEAGNTLREIVLECIELQHSIAELDAVLILKAEPVKEQSWWRDFLKFRV